MSIANEHTDTFYVTHFDFKDPVNATQIITFWSNDPVLGLNLNTKMLNLLTNGALEFKK